MDKSISVTHSIYGTFDLKRLRLTIESIKQQDNPLVEIIVSEQNTEPLFKDSASDLGVTYVFSEPKIVEGNPIYLPGRIRNKALEKVKTNFVYMNDSDVLFQNPSYLNHLIEVLSDDENLCLSRPQMKRLVLSSFEKFNQNFLSDGLDSAIQSLTSPNDYVSLVGNADFPLKVIDRKGSLFTVAVSDYENYKSNPELKGWEPTFWHPVVHVGGIIARASQIDAVSAYSNAYKKWGYEDSDLQWKLGELFNMNFMNLADEFKVLHLDHPKGYFKPEIMKHNSNIFEQRKEDGITRALEFDKPFFGGTQYGK